MALANYGLVDKTQILESSLALLPAVIGMLLGQAIRGAISESTFRRVFFLSLLTLGAYITFNAIRSFG